MKRYQDGIKEAIEICKRYLPQQNLDSHIKVGFIMDELESKLSESAGSVSCEAHRPDNEELKKEYEHKFVDNTNLIGGESTFQKYIEPADIWEWISERILKVR